jgi:two-component system sensor histidine kinase/response regulator
MHPSAAARFCFDRPTRILVVDDDPLMRESAQLYLSTAGAQVRTARDGNSALDLLGRCEFDVALVDIEMPGMGGFDLVERLRGQDKLRRLPVIMLTVREDPTSIDWAYQAGATSYLTKPVNWRQLAHHVQQVVRSAKPGAGTAHPAARSDPARKAQAARAAAQREADKSRAVVFGVLLVTALTMILLWSITGQAG